MTDATKFAESFQRLNQEGINAATQSYGEVQKGLQALASQVTENSKKAFKDTTRTFEQILGAKSVEQVIEIQSQYAKRAYENYVAEASKLGEFYVDVLRRATSPWEQAVTRATNQTERAVREAA